MQRKLLSILLSAGILAVSAAAKSQTLTIKQATSRGSVTKGAAAGKDSHGHDHAHERRDVRFTIVWNDATPPAAIYYRMDAAHWLKCKATRPERRTFGGGPNDFMMVENHISISEIRKGESINLMVEEAPSDVQPEAVKKMPSGALFYQISGSDKWYAQKVTVNKLADVQTQ